MYEGMEICMDGRTIQIHLARPIVMLIDGKTGEILIEFNEDGTPFNSSEWADAEMDYEVSTDFPMYDYEN